MYWIIYEMDLNAYIQWSFRIRAVAFWYVRMYLRMKIFEVKNLEIRLCILLNIRVYSPAIYMETSRTVHGKWG
jgi:hypothetical protein